VDEFPQRKFPTGPQYGWIASDVSTAAPDLVYADPEGYLGVAYAHATVLVAEALKELQKKHEQEMSDMRQAYDKELSALKDDLLDLRENQLKPIIRYLSGEDCTYSDSGVPIVNGNQRKKCI